MKVAFVDALYFVALFNLRDQWHERAVATSKLVAETKLITTEDVLVELDHAAVPAVILSVGGFLGVGEKLVAVPVNQIRVGSEAKFITDLTKEQLTSALAEIEKQLAALGVRAH